MIQSQVMLNRLLVLFLASLVLSGCALGPTAVDKLTLGLPAANMPAEPTGQLNLFNTKTNNQTTKPTTINNSNQLAMKPTAELLALAPDQKIFATLKTNMGDIVVELFPATAPKTVGNFVGLAEGTQPWKDPRTGQLIEGTPLYNGVVFHRVISGFMIQGGDPTGTGMGGPGYVFGDEIVPDLTFDGPGYLAMANAGPGTNASQFFITTAATSWLTGKHTIFGRVSQGAEVVQAIEKVPTGEGDKPVTPIVINSIAITRQ